jgi:TRAP transporter TAXI family solute receptor
MKLRSIFVAVAVLLGIAGVLLGAVFVARMPRTYTLAVGPADLETHRYAQSLARAAADARDRVRYQIVTTSGAAESARLLEEGKANLAIVRSDYDLPANGQTLIVAAKRVAVVIAPQLRRGGVQTFADLKGKRVAVVRLTDPNLPLVRRMLAVAEIAESDVTLIESELQDLPELFGAGRIDAAIAIVVPAAPPVVEAMSALGKRLPGGWRIVPLPAAEAMASRIIGLETAELAAGIFGAGRPAEEVQTVAVSYRIMARSRMPNSVAGDIAKSINDLRTRMARLTPVAFTSEAPDAKTGARIPAHPGAIAYFDGESQTFLERNGELLLTFLWGGTLLGSAVSALLAWAFRRRHDDGGRLLDEILALTAEARMGPPHALPRIETRIDEIVAELARRRAKGWSSDAMTESASLALEHFRGVADAVRAR